jgi:hypothetical protein
MPSIVLAAFLLTASTALVPDGPPRAGPSPVRPFDLPRRLGPDPSGLRAFVEAGRHLYPHRPGQQSLRNISHVFGLDLETQASAGPISRNKTSAGAADGIAS